MKPTRPIPIFCLAVLTCVVTVSAQTSASGEKFEQRFLQSFSQHHQSAINMAQLCTEKAIHPDLKQRCQQMIASQQQEKQQMDSWLQSWYSDKGEAPVSLEAKLKVQQEKMMTQLHAASGNSFDHDFLVDMGQHHQMGIADTQKCVTQAVHPELKALCQKMKSEQEKDLNKMNAWVKEWK
ncbi:MAG: DUF305 domain-containing protein [Acidobacteriaceae bacterium]|nr:DUF305 domain-containing protein [Acidobacteriaceae bacterium]